MGVPKEFFILAHVCQEEEKQKWGYQHSGY